VTLQEAERGYLARDLHDDVRPFLFAIGIDAAAAARRLVEDQTREATEHIRSIAEAVPHA
jgi:two-component system, NarL family, sensor histidine kinase UhpB